MTLFTVYNRKHFPPMRKNYLPLPAACKVFILLFLCLLLNTSLLRSQITTTANGNAQQLVESIMGKGYTVTNSKLTCPTNASGTFVNITSNIGLGKGIILTTGSIDNIKGPNNNTGEGTPNNGAGDTELDNVTKVKTMDACVLEFDLVPSCDELKINYVFASEEYPEYVGLDYNDLFAFFISGPGITGTVNMATIPNSTTPVTINDVNSANNSQYFVDNANGATIQYDGFTKPLTASAKVIPCSSYHLKMAIADVGDESYDSGVFIEAGSINCIAPEIESPPVCANKATISLCAPAGYTYDWPAGQPGAVPPFNQQCLTVNNPKAGDVYTVNLTPGGGGCPSITKITLKGSDFTVKDTAVCIGAAKFPLIISTASPLDNYTFTWEPAANLSCTTCPSPIFDPISTQTYTVTMTDKDLSNCNRVKTVKVTVGTSFSITATGAEICEGETATLTASGADSYIWQPGNVTGASIQVSPAVTTTYTATGTVAGATCPGKPEATAIVTVGKQPVVSVNDVTICMGAMAKLSGSITGGSKVVWTGGGGTFSPDRTTLNATYTPSVAEISTGSVVLTLESEDPPGPCVKDSKAMKLTIIPAAVASAGPDQVVCTDSPVHLNATFSGSATTGMWASGKGTFEPDNFTATAVYTPNAAEIAAGKISLIYVASDPLTSCPAFSDTMLVSINQKHIVSAGDPIFICEGTTIKLNGIVSGGATGGTWTGGAGTYTKSNTDLKASYKPTAADIKAGKVTFKLTSDTNGVCPVAKAEVTHIIHPNPAIVFTTPNPKACAPHCINFIDSTTAGSTTVTKWEWDFGNGKSGKEQNPKQICYDKPGVYDVKLKATSDKNCVTTLIKEKMIETYKDPVAQFTADPNPASILEPTIHFFDQSQSNIKSWKWVFGDGMISSPNTQNPAHVYSSETPAKYIVQLVVVDTNGCKDSTEKEIEIQPYFAFYVPNAFTPDDRNGVNDVFYGTGVGISEYHMWIFDRWGNMIFETAELNKGWNGTLKNGTETSLMDVFVWKAKIKDVFGKSHNYTGTVTIAK